MAGTREEELSPTSGKRKDMDENLAEDGQGSIKKLKRMLTQEADLKVKAQVVECRSERLRCFEASQGFEASFAPERRGGLSHLRHVVLHQGVLVRWLTTVYTISATYEWCRTPMRLLRTCAIKNLVRLTCVSKK